MIGIDFDNCPPDPGPQLRIERVRANRSLEFVILSDIFGLWTHWLGDESQPCFKGKPCPHCKRELPRRWKGYLHALFTNKKGQGFVELTPLTARKIMDLCGTETALRGYRIKIWRHAGDKAHLGVEMLPPCEIKGKLPDAQDPWTVLAKLWKLPGTDKRKLDGGDRQELAS